MDLKKSEGGGITRLLPDGRLGSHYGLTAYSSGLKKEPVNVTEVAAQPPVNHHHHAGENNMNRCFPHQVMASVPQTGQHEHKQESFSDLLSSVLTPDEASVTGFEAAACHVDLSALDGLNLDFPPLNSNNSNNYSSVSEVVAAAIMATSEDTSTAAQPHQPSNFSSSSGKAGSAHS